MCVFQYLSPCAFLFNVIGVTDALIVLITYYISLDNIPIDKIEVIKMNMFNLTITIYNNLHFI